MTNNTVDTPSMPGGLSKGAKSGLFFGVLVAVLGVFSYLSSLETPPNLPAGGVHKLRFNNDSELIGVGEGEIATTDSAGGVLKMDKKSIEGRVNASCAACHGTPMMYTAAGGGDTTVCSNTPGKCVPENHPPKDTCIKCHRMGKASGKAAPPGAPGADLGAQKALTPPASHGALDGGIRPKAERQNDAGTAADVASPGAANPANPGAADAGS